MTLIKVRAVLNDEFSVMASRDGIEINHSLDVRTLNICDRIYDATFGNRRINIDFNPDSTLKIDSFVKEFESDLGSALLLTIFVNKAGLDVQRLWRICKSWLYGGMDADSPLPS